MDAMRFHGAAENEFGKKERVASDRNPLLQGSV
jgi:hypothetical protein